MTKHVITKEMIRQYAAVSGDAGSIHLDSDAAFKAGFDRPIAHGMLLMGLAQSMYLSAHPAKWISSYSMKFVHPLLAETAVQFEFSELVGEKETIRITLRAENEEIIAQGTLSVQEVHL